MIIDIGMWHFSKSSNVSKKETMDVNGRHQKSKTIGIAQVRGNSR